MDDGPRVTTAFLIERDQDRCVWCGHQVWPEDATVEHLCPSNRGGRKTVENCLLACHRCNSLRKSAAAAGFAGRRSQEGYQPRWELLRKTLEGLAGSARRRHREYAQIQLRHLPAQEDRAKAKSAGNV